MTKENLIPNTETVYELKNEYPSFEEFKKSYERDEGVISSYEDELNSNVGGYGPCKNSLCGCTCSSKECVCKSASIYIEETGGSLTAHFRKQEEEIDIDDIMESKDRSDLMRKTMMKTMG
jgi:hypothetical protein